MENFRYYGMAIGFVSNALCWWCYLYVFVTTAPFKTEDNWVNETNHWQQSQPKVIYETQDVSTKPEVCSDLTYLRGLLVITL